MTASLIEVVNQTRTLVDDAAVAALCAAVLAAEGASGAEVGVRFVGETRMRALNREHRGIDQVTDVLSFPLEEAGEWQEGGATDVAGDESDYDSESADGESDVAADLDFAVAESEVAGPASEVAAARPPRLLGDIVVCPRVAARQAISDAQPLSRELATLLIHGLLHLLGFDHETDEGAMIRRQEELLRDVRWEDLLFVRRGNLLNSFNWAFEGIVHALRRERNMKIHFAIAVLVLAAAMFYPLSRLEIVALFVAISFVLITEMINTSIERTIDLIIREDDPRARVAKDMAAGAVLVAAANALVVAYLVFYDKIAGAPSDVLTKLRNSPIDVSVIALVLVIMAAIILKAVTGRGTLLRGGLPSGHAAVSFAGWVAITFIAADTATSYALPISAIGLLMAVLVAQSRVQAGIHTVVEVALGALLGIAVALVIFKLWFPG